MQPLTLPKNVYLLFVALVLPMYGPCPMVQASDEAPSLARPVMAGQPEEDDDAKEQDSTGWVCLSCRVLYPRGAARDKFYRQQMPLGFGKL